MSMVTLAPNNSFIQADVPSARRLIQALVASLPDSGRSPLAGLGRAETFETPSVARLAYEKSV